MCKATGIHTRQLLIIFLFILGPAGAAAQGMPPFEELDEDANGSISREEARDVPELDFNTIDTDEDGEISRSEYDLATTVEYW